MLILYTAEIDADEVWIIQQLLTHIFLFKPSAYSQDSTALFRVYFHFILTKFSQSTLSRAPVRFTPYLTRLSKYLSSISIS